MESNNTEELLFHGLSSCVLTVCEETGDALVLQSTGMLRGMGDMYWCIDDVTETRDKVKVRPVAPLEETLDFDAIVVIKENQDCIQKALRECDRRKFLGYDLHLGNNLFLTIDRKDCVVDIRKWFVSSEKRDGVNRKEVDLLLPSERGIRLNYSKFMHLVEFLETDFLKMFPQFKHHVLMCDQARQ